VEASSERLLLYSIINSLTLLDGIDKVQLEIEGEALHTYTYIDISTPLTRARNLSRQARITGQAAWSMFI
jgi:spore germination protein GerM